jgi:photosystem II stability/assembly factor-like uncharacterized protein
MKKSAILLFLLLVFSNVSFSQWTQQQSNTTSNLTDVFFLNDSVGFAVGGGGVFLKTVNGGQVWDMTIIDSSKNLNAVAATSPNNIFAGGNGMYKSTDGGSTWTTIDINFVVLQLVFFSDNIGYAKSSWIEQCWSSMGHESKTRYRYRETTDGGQNWGPSDLDEGQTCGAMEMVSSDIGYLGSWHEDMYNNVHCETNFHGLFYKTINGGLTWTEPLGWFYDDFRHTSFISDSVGFAITFWASPHLEKTVDGANSFTYISTLPELPTLLAFANEYEGYFIKDNQIYKTTTGGCLWEVNHNIGSSLKDIVITDNYMAYVVGDNGTILHNVLDPVNNPDSIYSISCNKQQLEFPLTSVNGESLQTLTLKSSGSMEIMVSITAPPDFLVKIQGDTVFSPEIDSLILQAQHDTMIVVAFQPSQAGNYSTNLEIQTNAFNDTTILIPMTGTAIYALSGLITNDTLICQDTIQLIGTTTVEEGARLTICPGTIFLFKGLYALEIKGSLRAIGEPGDSIIFTPENKVEGWNGIRVTGDDPDSTILKYCRIEYGNVEWDNYYSKGGGLAIEKNSKVLVSHCEISHCAANSAGGGIYIEGASPTIQFCELKYNSGHYDGGGICIKDANPQIRNNIIHHNSSNDYGGGISAISSSPSIMNNTIYSNTAHFGGGITLDNEYNENPAPVMQNLIFNNNASYSGGGIYALEAEPDFMNNTVCNNAAGTNGGGMKAVNAGQTFIEGNIFYGNAGGQVILDAAYLIVSYCNIQGGWTGSGHENIDAEPGFLNPSPGTGLIEGDAGLDWSFLASSPNYNIGIPDSIGLGLPPYDFGGYPRIYDGRMDIGAFESHFYKQLLDTAVCIGDAFFLSVIPSGEGPFSFEWKHDDVLIQEADSNVLLIESVSLEDAGYYQCRVICSEGDFYSNKVWLSLETTIPQILDHPEGGLIKEGESFTLSVSADHAVTFQWYLNDSLVEGATDSLLVINNFSAELQGSYRCYAENGCGGIFSDSALLTLDHSGIDGYCDSRLIIFPNPARRELAVGSKQSITKLTITNLYGREVKVFRNISSFPFLLDISDLQPGMYILRAINKDGESGSAKFLKISL